MALSKRTYPVIIEQDDDGMYVATIPSISGCFTQGDTIEQVLERAKEAVRSCDRDGVPPLKFIDVQKIRA